MTQQSFFERLGQAVEKAGDITLTQEQADELVRIAQAIEQMRLARLSALVALELMSRDFDTFLSKMQVSDAAREVMEFFIELELVAYADALRGLLKDKDAEIRRDLFTPPQPHVIDITPAQPVFDPIQWRRIVQFLLGIGGLITGLWLWAAGSPSGEIGWSMGCVVIPFFFVILYIIVKLEG